MYNRTSCNLLIIFKLLNFKIISHFIPLELFFFRKLERIRMEEIFLFSKWFYRGEGNNTLVIYSPENRTVLRLPKSNVCRAKEETSFLYCRAKTLQSLQKGLKMGEQVFLPLIGAEYVQNGSIIELPDSFIKNITDLITSSNEERPKYRLMKEVSPYNKFAVLMPDFCFVRSYGTDISSPRDMTTPMGAAGNLLPTFCVEIKPKCATLPMFRGVGCKARIKTSMCKFCLTQWTKVYRDGKYLQRSGYCPLDLFSADIHRVWHALLCLLENPQNNLKIFKDGISMYSGDLTSPSEYQHCITSGDDTLPFSIMTPQYKKQLIQLEEDLNNTLISGQFFGTNLDHSLEDGINLNSTIFLLSTLLQLLIHDSNQNTTEDVSESDQIPQICKGSRYLRSKNSKSIPEELVSKNLSFGNHGVFQRILNVQKLDEIGNNEALLIFNNLCEKGHQDNVDFCLENARMHTSKNDVNKSTNGMTLRFEKPPRLNQNARRLQGEHQYHASEEKEMEALIKYLISASSKDCSVMISFQEITQGNTNYKKCFKEVFSGKVFNYSIAVVDLDFKGSERIPKYYQEDEDIVDNYFHFNT